jgi:four helix bundle protein
MQRCAVSIPSNLAEGYSRRSRSDYLRFLQIALGSLYEFQTQLEIAKSLQYLESVAYNSLDVDTREIERVLISLIRRLTPKS